MQEFNDRTVYNPEKSTLTISKESVHQAKEQKTVTNSAEEPADLGKVAMLFTTKTCPNCKMAKSILDNDHYAYKVVDAEVEVDLTKKFDVKQAPTLVIVNGNTVERIQNVSNIKKYVKG